MGNSIERDIARRLENEHSDVFRRIWVDRSKYNLCVTAFPLGISENYLIAITVKRNKALYHGMSQETRFEDAEELLLELKERYNNR